MRISRIIIAYQYRRLAVVEKGEGLAKSAFLRMNLLQIVFITVRIELSQALLRVVISLRTICSLGV